MTIPKRDKRRRRGEKSPAYPPADKMVRDSLVKTPGGTPFPFYTRVCPYCGQGSLSTICQKCGRLTVFRNK